jgi:hypothetical protein
MSAPNYSEYTLEELYEALRTIDMDSFPERVVIIKNEIASREVEQESQQEKRSQSENQAIDRKNFSRFLIPFRRGSIFLYTISLVYGLTIFIKMIFDINLSEFAYTIQFQFPGSGALDRETLPVLFNFIILPIHIGLIVGSIGSFFGNNFSRIILSILWGILAIGIQFWIFKWWPTLSFDQAIGFVFDLFGVDLGFKINVLTGFLFLWSSIFVLNIEEYLR